VFATIVSILMMILGIILILIVALYNALGGADTVCGAGTGTAQAPTSFSNIGRSSGSSSRMNEFDDDYAKYVGNEMCTLGCPCWSGNVGDSTEVGPTQALYDAETAKARGRKTINPLVWSNDPTESFETMVECSAKGRTSSSSRRFVAKGTVDFIKAAEVNYDCSGLCTPGLFYLTRPLSDGPPTSGCLRIFLEEFPAGLNNTAICTVLTSILLCFGCCFGISICGGNTDSDGDQVAPVKSVPENETAPQ
jgi:hypothetical protein